MHHDHAAQIESGQGFSESGFWNKLRRHARRIGRRAVEQALRLYYTARQPSTPAWARRAIYAALAYLILPVDAIPDMIPGLGFTDDLATLAAALATVAYYVTPEVKKRAADQTNKWFGENR